jgi:two-component system chemotaxis response regulator CheB
MPEEKIKVLLIEDSGLMRLIISDILRTDATIEVVDTAENGKEGLEKTLQYKPHVVVTDVTMPEYDGVYAVRKIMEQIPTPIVVLSSLGKVNSLVFDALYEGAIDFVDKPRNNSVSGIREVNSQLLNAIKAASKANPQSLIREKRRKSSVPVTEAKSTYDAICLGASTGGPGAIEKIIEKLPASVSIPVIIAQHMPQRFIESFAKRLDSVTPLRVQLACKGEKLAGNTIYLAPGHSNTQIIQDIYSGRPVFSYTSRAYAEFNFPSVDCLMLSAAKVYKHKLIGVILSGMGKDGTEGMRAIYDAGGYTIAQDEASSIVYGMPKCVVENGAARSIIPLEDIPAAIIKCL